MRFHYFPVLSRLENWLDLQVSAVQCIEARKHRVHSKALILHPLIEVGPLGTHQGMKFRGAGLALRGDVPPAPEDELG